MTRSKRTAQASPVQETTNNKVGRLENTVLRLEEIIEQMQTVIEQQNNKYEEAINGLKTTLEDTNKEVMSLRQLINDTDTKIAIEIARREREIQNIRNIKPEEPTVRPSTIEMTMPTFSGEQKDEHPKSFLKDLNSYFTHKNITPTDKIIVIENCLKGKAAKWFGMIKDTTPTAEAFKTLFLKHFFSDDKQWDIFIRCTEAGKRPIKNGFQEHFHHWMAELRYLDSPKMDEEQAISLIIKHFPIAVQAYIQSTQEKKFLNIWEKLGELENNNKERVDGDEQVNNTYSEQIVTKHDQPKKFNSRYGQTHTPKQPHTFDNRYGQTTQRTQEFSSRYGQKPTTQQVSQSSPNIRHKFNYPQQRPQDTGSGHYHDTQKTISQVTVDNTIVEDEHDSEDEDEYDEESKNGKTGIMASDLL